MRQKQGMFTLEGNNYCSEFGGWVRHHTYGFQMQQLSKQTLQTKARNVQVRREQLLVRIWIIATVYQYSVKLDQPKKQWYVLEHYCD